MNWVILKYELGYNHPQPPTTIQNHPQPPKKSSATTHKHPQSSTIIHNNPQLPTTTHSYPQPPKITQKPVHNHPQTFITIYNQPQPPTITQKLPKKAKTCHIQLFYCTLLYFTSEQLLWFYTFYKMYQKKIYLKSSMVLPCTSKQYSVLWSINVIYKKTVI